MQQTQSSMHTHYQSHGGKSNDHAKLLLYASADETLQPQEVNEDEEPIETRLNLYTSQPRDVRKYNYEQRGRGRKAFRSSRTGSMGRFGGRSGENSRPGRTRDLSGSNRVQIRENDPCLGCNSTDHIPADRQCKPDYSKIRANLLRKGLDMPSAAAFAA